MLLSLLAFVAVCACAAARESRVVQTAQGPVRGYQSEDGDLIQFFGIPYATAPTGENRFTAPLPGPVWMQTFEAVDKDIICPQAESPLMPNKKMQENCLIANVHVPITGGTNLPVYVYVHGGGYMLGTGELGSVSFLARSRKLIVITFNYRVGAHGFLCLGTKKAPGNAGMKDQVALLRWVQKNIASFGGNPEDVTLAGGSAGSSAVDLLMLSDLTKGLYSKVVPESGSSLSPWSIQVDPIEYAKDFALLKNVSNVDKVNDLEHFYTSASLKDIVTEGLLIRLDSSIHFTPCIERDIGQEMFLKDTPFNILKQGKFRKVPLLYGFANMEGLLMIDFFGSRKEKMNERFSDFLPPDLGFRSEDEKEKVAELVKEFYFGDRQIDEDSIQGYIDYYSDIMFACPTLRTAKLQVEAGSDSIYLYEYSFFSPFAKGLYPDFMSHVQGAPHGAQAVAVYEPDFGTLFIDDNSEDYKIMKKTIQEYWINFITTGNPVPEGSALPKWPPVGADWSPYLNLGQEIRVKGPLLERRCTFWSDIYEQHYRAPSSPSPATVRSEL